MTMDFEEENHDNFTHRNLRDEIIRSALKRREIYIYGEIDPDMELFVIRQIERFSVPDRNGNKLPITLKISSEGGQVFSALAIVSAIEKAKEDGYEIIGKGYGIVMSAAVNIFIACSKRISSRFCRYMLHDLGSFQIGFRSREDLKDDYQEHQALWEKLKTLILKDTTIDPDFLDETVEKKKEYSFWPERALQLGICDIIE